MVILWNRILDLVQWKPLREFLEGNKNFVIDKSKEKFYITFSPNGFLKRVS